MAKGKTKTTGTAVAKREPALVADKRAVGNLMRAVQRKKLTPDQHALLQALIVQMERVEDTGEAEGLGTTVRYNLQVIDTQIRDVLARGGGDVFDEDAIASLPPAMHARILERLENVAERLESDRAREKIEKVPTYTSGPFQCLDDYDTCLKSATAAKYWCTIALLVCLAGKLGEAFVTGKKS